MNFTPADFEPISWSEFDQIMDTVSQKVKNFLDESGLSVRYIVPVLRGGMIPAVVLGHKLSVIDFMPVQVKCLGKGRSEVRFDPTCVPLESPSENECVIVVDDNQVSGGTVNKAMDIVRKKFGSDTKIIYVRLSVDYACQDKVSGTIFIANGILTNETESLSDAECDAYGVRVKKLALMPWETATEELHQMAINAARP